MKLSIEGDSGKQEIHIDVFQLYEVDAYDLDFLYRGLCEEEQEDFRLQNGLHEITSENLEHKIKELMLGIERTRAVKILESLGNDLGENNDKSQSL